MFTILASYYYQDKKYDKFFEYFEKSSQITGFDLFLGQKVIEYYLDIKPDLTKALETVELAERMIQENENLDHFLGFYLPLKARIYYLKEDLENAIHYGELAWSNYENREKDLFNQIIGIYKIQEDWERLENFCLSVYYEDEYDPVVFPHLYFAHLKRNSQIKAQMLYDKVERYYPEYLEQLDTIREELIE